MTAFFVVLLYMAFLLVLSFMARARQKKTEKEGSKAEGFLLASRSFGPVLVAFTLIGSALGANGTVGIAQNGYKFGISAFWYDGAFGIGIIVAAFLFVGQLRKLNLMTITQVYGDFYGESTRVLVSVGQIFMQFCIMVSQYIAGGVILNAILPQYFSYTGGMITSAAIYIIIAMIGGMSSTAFTNVLNICLLYGGALIAVIMCLIKGGGLSGIIAATPDPALYTDPVDGLTLGVTISYVLLFLVNVPTGTASIQFAFSAKDSKSAKWAYFWAGVAVLPFGLSTALVGMYAAGAFPNLQNTASALPAVVMTFPGLLAGIVLAGMWAADVSSATAYIMGGSALFVNDIYKPLIKKGKATDQEQLVCSKVVAVVFALAALFAAFQITSLLQFTTFGLALSVGYFIVLIASIYFPSLCKKSTANVLFIVSFINSVVWQLSASASSPFHFVRALPHITFLHLIVLLPLFFLIAALDKRPAFFRTKAYEEKYGQKALPNLVVAE